MVKRGGLLVYPELASMVICNRKCAVEDMGTSKGIVVNSADLVIIASKTCFETGCFGTGWKNVMLQIEYNK